MCSKCEAGSRWAGGQAGLLHEGHQGAVQGLGAEELGYLHLEDQPDERHHQRR